MTFNKTYSRDRGEIEINTSVHPGRVLMTKDLSDYKTESNNPEDNKMVKEEGVDQYYFQFGNR